MTDKKVIAVVGATGAQGGGMARAILDDPDGAWACRAITRNPRTWRVPPRRQGSNTLSGQPRRTRAGGSHSKTTACPPCKAGTRSPTSTLKAKQTASSPRTAFRPPSCLRLSSGRTSWGSARRCGAKMVFSG
jgi:hypothetical protein